MERTMSTLIKSDGFALFPLLPPEVRLMIWETVLLSTTQRTIDTSGRPKEGTTDDTLWRSYSESRKAFLCRFTEIELDISVFGIHYMDQERKFIDFDRDSLDVGLLPFRYLKHGVERFGRFLNVQDVERATKVTFTTDWAFFQTPSIDLFWDTYTMNPKIEEVNLVLYTLPPSHLDIGRYIDPKDLIAKQRELLYQTWDTQSSPCMQKCQDFWKSNEWEWKMPTLKDIKIDGWYARTN